jgi:hypothetical protein
MKRRKFIALTSTGALAVITPYCRSRKNTTLSQPLFLSTLCDIKTLTQIGNDYRAKNPTETDEATLTQLLTATTAGSATASAVQLDNQVRQDFAADKTTIIDGWILSITEARQCALLSLQKP